MHHLTTASAELNSLEQFTGVSLPEKSMVERRHALEVYLTI